MEIPEKCEGCPRIAPYVKGLEKIEANRDQALLYAKKFMEGGDSAAVSADELREFLEQHEILLGTAEVTSRDGVQNAADLLGSLLQRLDQSDDNVRSSTEDTLQACDDATDAYNRMIEMFTKDCKSGPKMRRKYIIFGRKALRCGSVSFARIVPERFLS